MRCVAVLVCFFLAACGDSGKEAVPGRPQDLPPAGETKALTDGQIEKFIGAAREIEPLKAADSTTEAMKAWQSRRAKAIQRHGMSETEYGLIEVRMRAVVTILGYEAPVPPELKADCEIAKKHLDELRSVLRMK